MKPTGMKLEPGSIGFSHRKLDGLASKRSWASILGDDGPS